jgi:aspartate aminotransferase
MARPIETGLNLSRNVDRLLSPTIAEIRAEARNRRSAGEDVLDLASDEPRYEVSRVIVEAGLKAIQQAKRDFVPDAGILDLRVAIARHLSLLSGGRAVNADNVIVSNGARQSVFGACFALFDSSDEVLVPSPTWYSLPQSVCLARARPVKVAGDVEWSLKVGVDQLSRAATPDTAGIILCTPVNPTGAVYTRAELKAIVEWALERGCWVISDEVCRRIHFGSGPAPSVLDLPDELLERVIVVGGASKTYAMSGWRLGYSLVPHALVKTMTALQSHMTGGAPRASQWAGVAAFSDERVEADVERMVEGIRRCRDLAVSHFRHRLPGIEFIDPLGGQHLFFRIDACFGGDVDCASVFCKRLLAEKGVALVPGEAFGDDRWVRLSYACPEKDLLRALERISDLTAALAAVSN